MEEEEENEEEEDTARMEKDFFFFVEKVRFRGCEVVEEEKEEKEEEDDIVAFSARATPNGFMKTNQTTKSLSISETKKLTTTFRV